VDTVFGIVAGTVLGIILTVIGTRYLFSLQRRRLELGWEVLSSTLIVTSPETPDIKVVVSPRLFNSNRQARYVVKGSGGQGEEGWTAIQEFRSYLIRVQNAGNQVIRSQMVNFVLEREARVVSLAVESQPQLGGQTIATELQTPWPNAATAIIPFLNPRNDVVFSLQAVNATTPECEVMAGAPGLLFFNLARRRAVRDVTLMVPATVILAVPLLILTVLEATGSGPHILDHDSPNTIWNYVATVSLVVSILMALRFAVSVNRLNARRPRRKR
jgi:hypothetical protein